MHSSFLPHRKKRLVSGIKCKGSEQSRKQKWRDTVLVRAAFLVTLSTAWLLIPPFWSLVTLVPFQSDNMRFIMQGKHCQWTTVGRTTLGTFFFLLHNLLAFSHIHTMPPGIAISVSLDIIANFHLFLFLKPYFGLYPITYLWECYLFFFSFDHLKFGVFSTHNLTQAF